MSTDLDQFTREPMIRLLSVVFADFSEELFRRFARRRVSTTSVPAMGACSATSTPRARG